MPFDGIVTKCVVDELREQLDGGRIDKIFQPEKDELLINIRAKGENLKLLLCANPNFPRIHLTSVSKENPAVPPVFCMLLRKHIGGGRITDIVFHDFERIVTICIEAVNELGDVVTKKLVIEIMGRYSNIMLLNNCDKILDAIKHVDKDISSVREVMPARQYTLPPKQDKQSPLEIDAAAFTQNLVKPQNVEKAILETIKGFSPLLCREITARAGIDGRKSCTDLLESEKELLSDVLGEILSSIKAGDFIPTIAYTDSSLAKQVDYHCVELKQYSYKKNFKSISETIDTYYTSIDFEDRLKQKKATLQKHLTNLIERCAKKVSIQNETILDVSNREDLRLYGELLTANLYNLEQGARSARVVNYYSENGENIDIPLDENLSPSANAQRFFKKYAKAKTTYEYTSKQLQESLAEQEYLDSVQIMLDNSTTTQEIDEIRQELVSQGYITKSTSSKKKKEIVSSPLTFISSDGYKIRVGRNNVQNDTLTLKLSSSNDIWFHTKTIPGSHVVIQKAQGSIPDSTLLEAAKIAAWHSKAKMSSNVEVDYTEIRNVKKPSGAKPGKVIYENYRTLVVNPDKALADKLCSDKKHKS